MTPVDVPFLSADDKAVLEFSGGKDSVAALYLCRPFLGQITVVFGDTGAVFPHVREFVRTTCRRIGAKLEVVKPHEDIRAYQGRTGLPADIVPVERWLMTRDGEQMLQPYIHCCAAMIWSPLHDFVLRAGAKTVIRGNKRCDSRQGLPDGAIQDGILYRSPVWEWSDEQVRDYLDDQGVVLPAHYRDGLNDSLDCWNAATWRMNN